MANENKSQKAGNENKTPAPGTKEDLKAELEAANTKLAAVMAELEQMKNAQSQNQGSAEPQAPATTDKKVRERVKIYVPRGASNEDPNLFISVNGVNYLLPKGKESEVPAHIAAEYQRIVKAQERGDRSKAQLLDAAKQ